MTSLRRRLLDDCFLHDKDRLRHDDALALLSERLQPIAGIEEVALEAALGRVLAVDVAAERDVPGFDNAAVDGYAFAHADLSPDGATVLEVSDRVAAGAAVPKPLRPRTAARIFTGAIMPQGADTVIMQEDVTRREEDGRAFVEIPAGLRRGANCRLAGEDVKAGEIAIAAGERLRPQELAKIASIGLDRVACRQRLKVAIASTGDELIRPGAAYAPGRVYDSNHYLLSSLLTTAGTDVVDLGILPDDPVVVRETLLSAGESVDILFTTGGASRGEEDHVVATLAEYGTLHAWQLAVKPGRPLAFGRIGDAAFLGLPGNPVAVMICFLLYARPMLAMLEGARWHPPQRYRIPAGFAIARKKPDRREFLRGWIEMEHGTAVLKRFPRDGSGLISSLTAADGLIEIAEEVTEVAEGDLLDFIPFPELGLTPR